MIDEDHIVTDLETMGINPQAVICTIAAVVFNPFTGAIGATFEKRIDLERHQPTRSVDISAVKWWLQQDDDARIKLTKNADCSLDNALEELRNFIEFFTNPDEVKMWGNGATFDISILENAFNYNAPWKFWNVRDMRTVLDLAQLKGYGKRKFTGVKHSALDDAIYQAKVVSDCYETLLSKTKSELL